MSRFFSKTLDELEPYVPGEQPKVSDYIKLNTNESPYPPAPEVLDAIDLSEVSRLNLYSDPTCDELVSEIAKYYNIDKDMVFVGNGSDEVLAFCFRAYADNGFVCPDITYGFYPVFAGFFNVDLKTIPLKEDFSINSSDYYNRKENIIIANPNAQTGIYLECEEIEKIIENNKEKIVVVDEAYIDFGGESALKLIDRYDNLIVVRTFSKSRNLAGARIGFAMANKKLIADLNTLKYSFNPYNLNRLSIIAGAESIKNKAYFEQCTGEIIQTREYTKDALGELGYSFTDSKANFILAKSDKMSGIELYEKLKENGILVRYLGIDRIEDYVRITIGTKTQMEKLVKILQEI
ncbi:MAG: histidinol-phosphate transaminase [Clostridia bacterium]|nr:histidinol-phosphate transaminase [Clostridia bacterium]